MSHAVERVAQHVARPRLERLQPFAAGLLDGGVDIGDELDQLALGGGEAAHVHIDGGQRQPCLDMRRRAADRVAETPGRFVEAALPARHQAEVVGQHRLVGVLGQRLAPHCFGIGQSAALRQADREVMQDVGPLAIAAEGGTKQRLGAVEPAGAQILQAGLKIGIGLGRRCGRRLGHGALCRPGPRPRLHQTPWSRTRDCSRRRWPV